MNETISAETPIMGVPAGLIAGVIEASAGFFAGRRYEGLLGAAQAIRDMTESGRYGTGLARVLRYHFPPPRRRFHADCLQAAVDVFRDGCARDPSWMILSLRRERAFLPKRKALTVCGAQKDGPLILLGSDSVGFGRGVRYYGVIRPLPDQTNKAEKETEEGVDP